MRAHAVRTFAFGRRTEHIIFKDITSGTLPLRWKQRMFVHSRNSGKVIVLFSEFYRLPKRKDVFVQYSTKLICMIYCFWRLQYLAPGNTNLDRKHGTVLFLFGKKLAWSHRYISNYYYQILYSIAFWFNAQLLHLVGNIEFYNVNWWEILWNKVNTNWNQLNVTI